MTYIIGIDIGGTFTDAFAGNEVGRAFSAKAPSTPKDLAEGVVNSLRELADVAETSLEEFLADTSYICHGTTSSLNALVTGNVARVGFLTTKGHADSIRIMNAEGRHTGLSPEQMQNMPQTDKPPPLVHRSLVREITERVDHKGSVIISIDESEVRDAVNDLLKLDVEAIAVSFLWSFRNPAHEQVVERIVNEVAPGMYVGLSSTLSPRIREYSRNVTTIMSTQVAPRLRAYLDPLSQRLHGLGFTGSLLVMQGSGGAVTFEDAPNKAITTVGSVLTGGIVGCVRMGELLGHRNIISTDMGGTTFLVGLVVDQQPVIVPTTILGQYKINAPMVDVTTIGSGGGAIAWIDDGGNLRVGPDSAGALPGPACYGAGGSRPTITDANLVLGILNPDYFLGGRKKLNLKLAEDAIRTHVGDSLGLTVEEAAAAIYAITNAQTADLVRRVVVGSGHDPRDFVLYAFGGCGPVHCASYSAEIGVSSVLVPLGTTASAFSAYGLAASDILVSAESSSPSNFPLNVGQVNSEFGALEAKLAADLARQGIEFSETISAREIDIKYSMQLAEVATPVPNGILTSDQVIGVGQAFDEKYQRLFGAGSGFREAGLQAITYRAFATGVLPMRPELPLLSGAVSGPIEPQNYRKVWLSAEHGWQRTAVYDYNQLCPGATLRGPAVVEAATTTVSIPEGTRGVIDAYGNMLLEFQTLE
ncbi:hydantoinase/oxoprolinase family protein [Amycolatopsis sp. H20-H5]|uniref:hydantoinase/oxoprolinase family protein n=1 Tax=Amycolatopsis sp. H20-H5 TaxID=3046309 RepID=UPI002DB96709|nr:hydantoinase/oxoprolinase family protein [Amycolatopsis sp. H20-H5]MEC3974446.1 hydantoinase/oxoprolinase family protein [Amycolatopsis sp. H20-H5]